MNSLQLIGNIGKDPQVNGAVTTVTVAVQRPYKSKQTNEYETDWFQCKAFGKTGELIANHLTKGSKIAFNGRIQNNNYEKDGKMIYQNDIIINDITFIDSKKSNQSNSNQTQTTNKQVKDSDPFDNNDSIDIKDDDLPF